MMLFHVHFLVVLFSFLKAVEMKINTRAQAHQSSFGPSPKLKRKRNRFAQPILLLVT